MEAGRRLRMVKAARGYGYAPAGGMPMMMMMKCIIHPFLYIWKRQIYWQSFYLKMWKQNIQIEITLRATTA